MTYSPIQLEVLRTFGKKELSEGCLIETIPYKEIKTFLENDSFPYVKTTDSKIYNYRYINILGHIPTLEDVFRVAEEKGWEYELLANPEGHELFIYRTGEKLFHTTYTPSLSFLEQPEETLVQLLTLFK